MRQVIIAVRIIFVRPFGFIALRHRRARFPRAIELDRSWAELHASLGDLYFAMAFYGWRPFDGMIARAREEARRAIDLVPSHPPRPRGARDYRGPHDQ